ncbi:MAG: class I SAM-dependent methyltransferase, partial [Spirochaetaceae bacterium]|nr:class I SAM-dependent methyltransferase [Spirochaetaceae bacterium]
KPGGLFSLITLLEVFEHIPDPFKVMMNLASRLTDGGRLCISTEFLPSDFARFEYWRYLSDETHIGLYTGRGLAEAGQRAGFIEEDCDGKRYLSFRLAHRGSSC